MSASKKVKVRTDEKIRVLIADSDGQSSRRTLNFLTQHGFDVRFCPNGNETKKLLSKWKPKIILVDLLLPEANAFELLEFCKNDSQLRGHQISFLIMSGHNSPENVREAYQRGARDYIARPFMYQDLLNRIVFHCRTNREIEAGENAQTKSSLKIADLVVAQALQNISMEENLYQLTQMVALKTKGMRCSVVYCMTHEKGTVLASNDKQDIAGLTLELKKYPEIQLVSNTQKTVVIDNLDESRALSQIKKDFREIDFNAMIVSPILYRHKPFGVLSLRMPQKNGRLSDANIEFVDYMAKVMSLYLSTLDPSTISRYGLIGVPQIK